MGSVICGQVVLGCVEKQTEQARRNKQEAVLLLCGLYFNSCFPVPLWSSCPDFPHTGLLPEVQDEANPVPSKLLLVRIFITAVGTEPGHTFRPHLASPRVCISNKTSELTLIIFWYQSILAFLEIFSNLTNLKCVFLCYYSAPWGARSNHRQEAMIENMQCQRNVIKVQ